MKEQRKQCSKCKATFNAQNGKRAGKLWYCGYCAAVILGHPNEDWLPKIKDKEDIAYLRKRGIHRT